MEWFLYVRDLIHERAKCNTDPRGIASIFTLQEQKIETKTRIKMRDTSFIQAGLRYS